MAASDWKTHNPSGSKRVIVTKELPGARWLEILTAADCSVDVNTSSDVAGTEQIKERIGTGCDGAIGQLTETWGDELFSALKKAGGKVYSNYAVGYNNVDVSSASKHGIPVGNTPGVLTETTAEMAVALTFAAARRVVEADGFMRSGKYKGWLPGLFLGELLSGKTVGVIGCGRIGSTYARMMAEGFKANIVYFDRHSNEELEKYIADYSKLLESRGKASVTCRRVDTVEEALSAADVVSLHPVLDDSTFHLINEERLAAMKKNAILVNTSRGPIVDEQALVAHCRKNPDFRAALDVFEDEPEMKPGLKDLPNVVIVPHIASATRWTREAMAVLAASNVAGILGGHGVWGEAKGVSPFLGENPPKAAPSIINAERLGLKSFAG